jgi:chromosome segregation ATPase
VKSVRALQSKQDKLERDIGPIEANVNELRKTADEVCKYFPQEQANVQAKLTVVEGLWSKLRDEVRTRKAKLDEKHGLQRFENEVADFRELCGQMRVRLGELDNPLDLKQCEDMQKRFEELEQQV